MIEEPPAEGDLGWLALADRYVAEAVEAGRHAQHDPKPPRKAKPSDNDLALANRAVARAEARVARQEAAVDRLVQDKRDTVKAQELLHLMRQALNLSCERRQAFLDRSRPRKPKPRRQLSPHAVPSSAVLTSYE